MTTSVNNPSIDVVIPVYNGERFIRAALDSVIAQTYSPTCVIVVDDGSTDSTYSIVSIYAQTSNVPITVVQKSNGGLSSARNAGIKASTSEYIAFLDADDAWLPTKLQEQVRIYQTSPYKNLGLVYCNYDVINTAGVVQYTNYKAPIDLKRMRGSVFKRLLERNMIAGSGSGVLIRRTVFDTVGLFDETLGFGEDWDMWLRIAGVYKVDVAPLILVHIRKHSENMTVDSAKIFKKELGFYDKWIGILGKGTPLFWADKVVFRIISQLPKHNLLSVFKESISKEHYKKLFRGIPFLLYIPIFFIRQLCLVFSPHYFTIVRGLIRHRGK